MIRRRTIQDRAIEGRGPKWRLLPYHVGSSAIHFALSDALSRHVAAPTVWWHSTDQPTLILGPTQSAEQINLPACEDAGILVVKRQAGGSAVFAATGVLGLDVALPAGHPLAAPDVVEAYRWIGEVWVAATRSLGVDSHLVGIEEARQTTTSARLSDTLVRKACFGSLSPYEVAVGPRKLVGLSQVRRRAGVLLQSGLHLDFFAEEVATLLSAIHAPELARSLASAAIGLNEATSTPQSAPAVMDAFSSALHRLHGVVLQEGEWSPEEIRYVADQLGRDALETNHQIDVRSLLE